MSTIGHGKVVSFHYTLTAPTGEVLDSSSGGDPLPYLHGFGNIVPGLERQLAGLKVGDKLVAKVPASEGYGDRDADAVQAVPRDRFPPGVEIEAGMQFVARGPQGQQVPVFVAKVEESTVWIDHNHPLAGVDLTFDVEIVEIRDGTADEQAHGHPHGPDGHHHH